MDDGFLNSLDHPPIDAPAHAPQCCAMPETLLDLRGLKCPLPALKLRKVLGRLAHGDVVIVQCTDPMAAIDIPHLLAETGDALLAQERGEGLLTFRVCKA